MALTDFFTISNVDARIYNGPSAPRTDPYPAEKTLALRNFKNDFVQYRQTGLGGNDDLNFIKIGLDRPFRQVYFDMSATPNLPGVGRSTWFYPTGTRYNFREFSMRDQVDDETGFLRQSGFVKLREIPADWRPDNDGLYSILIWCARTDPSAGEVDWQLPIRGINYVFSDDNDLERVRSDVVEASQGKGWGPKHVLARDFIMQQLRIKFQNKELTAFDIVNPWELRETSTFIALANIFKFELSKMAGDIFDTQADGLYMKAKKSFSTIDLSIDTNQSGTHNSEDTALTATDTVGTGSFNWT